MPFLPRRPLSPKARGLCVAALVLAVFGLGGLLFPGPLARLELSLSDLRYRLAPRPKASADIVHLDIDDASVRRLGGWPIKRSVHAQVLDLLTDCGVSAVAYDIVFHSPAKGPDGPANDATLEAAVARSGRVVFPVGVGLVREPDVVRLNPDADDLPLLPSLLAPGPLHVPDLPQAEKTFLPEALLGRRAASFGHIAATPDEDGVHRRMPLLVGVHGQLLPAMSLALVLRHLNARLEIAPGGLDIVSATERRHVPAEPPMLLALNLAAPWGSGFWHLSYAELLDAAQDPARLAFLRQGLAGRMVIIGLSASGTTDIKATPLSPAEPLVTLHSNLANMLLTGSYFRPAPAWAGWLFCAFFLAAAAVLYLRLPIRRFLPAGLALALACPAANLLLFRTGGILLNLTATSLATLLAVLSLLGHGLARTAAESLRQRRMLEAYFSPAIARQILNSGADIMEGRSVDLTVLFSDIAGFTAMSERMEPAEVQRLLGEYLEEMTACVFRNGGAVDKFMGDGVMAFFGYPEAEGLDSLENAKRSALAGVRAAVEMQAALRGLNRRWAAQGRQQVVIRIGLNTGHCVVGDMGSASRREFTLLGRNVNLGQRLESNAPRGGVLLSARTAALVRDHFVLEPPSFISVKGFEREVEVCAVRLPEEDK